MKIRQHPRMKDIHVGDEVLCYRTQLYARVEEVFPAAVCVKLVAFNGPGMRLQVWPQLWRADDIENLSVCRYCGGREELAIENLSSIPYQLCVTCRNVAHIPITGQETSPRDNARTRDRSLDNV